MALEVQMYRPAVFEANGDLSASQFCFVKMTATNRRVAVCATTGEHAIGVLQDKPNAAGVAAAIECGDGAITKVRLGGTVVAGDFVGTDTTGRAVTVQETFTGADLGKWVLGQCVEGGGADEYGTIRLSPKYRIEHA